MDFKPLVVHISYHHFNSFQFEVKLGSRPKSQDTSSHWTFCNSMLASAFHSCLSPSMFGHLLYQYHSISKFQDAHPSTKVDYLNSKYHSTSQSKASKSPANVRTPSITSSEPRPKRPENPSGATAAVVGRVHLGPCRDQLLDHGGVAVPSRLMQRRLASGAEDATRTAGRLRLPSRNKAYSHGMFLRVVGQKNWIGHR